MTEPALYRQLFNSFVKAMTENANSGMTLPTERQFAELLEALERNSGSLLQMPRELRERRVNRIAEDIGVSRDALNEVWKWRDTVGCKEVHGNGEE